MSTAPVITIFVRHSADCKYYGEEFYKKCNCRKHPPVGPPQIPKLLGRNKQFRLKAGTRSWAAAEELKRKKRSLRAAWRHRGRYPCFLSRLREDSLWLFFGPVQFF
jgi:hypothetical protein